MCLSLDMFRVRDTLLDQHQKRKRFDVIVVASLLEKLPNLAGLARTCEIFNVAQLAINDMTVLKDPAFTSISATANCWLPVIEVCFPKFVHADVNMLNMLHCLSQHVTGSRARYCKLFAEMQTRGLYCGCT